MPIDPRINLQDQRLSPQMPQVGMPVRPNPQGGMPPPQNMRGRAAMPPPAAMPPQPMPPGVMPAPAAMPPGALKKGGVVKNYATGGLTYAERKALMDEKVAPPRGTTKKEADIFREGMKPPKDDEGPVKQAKPISRAKGGSIKASKMGAVKVAKPKMSSASSRADGIAIRGKTRA